MAWQQHLQQRVLELAAAVRVNEPRLFSSRIAWLRRAAAARKSGDGEVLLALESLKIALDAELPDFVAACVRPVVELAIEESKNPVEPEGKVVDPASPEGRLSLEYIAACLDGDRTDPVRLILNAIDAGMRPQDVYCEVLLAAQKEVGMLWHVGDFSVAEERLVSETTRRVMALIAARFKPESATGPTMLAASVAGNAHDIGLRTVSDLFALAGWRCIFLGANVPTVEIANAARDYRADLAVLTATLTPQLNALTSAIAAIREAAPETRVLVGGIAFEESADVWKKIGADGFAESIDNVVEIGARMVAAPVARA
jgi:methanogenic corrinoid protein MtbC1